MKLQHCLLRGPP